MTVDFALNLASAAARVLAPDGGTVLIGKDTRLSGYMLSPRSKRASSRGRQCDAHRSAADARGCLHDAPLRGVISVR